MAMGSSRGAKSIDDPESVNAFLSRIGGSLVTCPLPATEREDSSPPTPGQTVLENDDLSAFIAMAEKSQKGLKDSKHACPDAKVQTPNQKKSGANNHASLESPEIEQHISIISMLPETALGLSDEISPATRPASPTAEDVTSLSSDTEPFAALEKIKSKDKSPSDVDSADVAETCNPDQLGKEADSTCKTKSEADTSFTAEDHLNEGGHNQLNKESSPSRKIILSGLPSNADYTLVAGLLHGGTLESFELFNTTTGSSKTKHAIALFTSVESAQKYCSAYPNGVQYMYGGKKGVAQVEAAKECDPLSAVLQGHLEAGACRVVRVRGADEDWSMRAMCELAERSDRKIEGICDYWRSEVRTIDFLFINISDAVHFRAQLLNEPEWQVCNIQFGEDPCGKASGVHLDG